MVFAPRKSACNDFFKTKVCTFVLTFMADEQVFLQDVKNKRETFSVCLEQ